MSAQDFQLLLTMLRRVQMYFRQDAFERQSLERDISQLLDLYQGPLP